MSSVEIPSRLNIQVLDERLRSQDDAIAKLLARIETLEAWKNISPPILVGDRVRLPLEKKCKDLAGYSGVVLQLVPINYHWTAILGDVRNKHAVRMPEKDGEIKVHTYLLEHDKEYEGTSPIS